MNFIHCCRRWKKLGLDLTIDKVGQDTPIKIMAMPTQRGGTCNLRTYQIRENLTGHFSRGQVSGYWTPWPATLMAIIDKKDEQRSHSHRRSVFVDRTRAPRNCRMTGHRSWATRRCKATVDTSAGVCCRETRCTSGCRFPSTADDTPTSSCCPLRSQTRRTRPESFQCFRTASTRRRSLSVNIIKI